MTDAITIQKNPTLLPDEDYAFLRSEGLKYIEELGSSLWTDYNEHDPGITILEALCYAITELVYRAGMPMKDLLTEENGHIASSQVLFTPKKILTQAPLTINDYRKLLIDINGVHNAWLFTNDTYAVNGITAPAGEVPIFADCKKDELTYEVTPHPVYLSGLYKVLLDLDDNLQAGSLNDGELQVLSPAITGYKAGAVSFTIILPVWSDDVNANLLKAKKDSLISITSTVAADGTDWKLKVDFSFIIDGDPAIHAAALEGKVIIDLKPADRIVTLADMQAFFSGAFTQQVINLYIYKIQTAKRIVQTVLKKLHENRNLCEDFVSVETIENEELAICCDIDISPETDMEQVQADVFYAIQEYLNPSINFYLLKDLISKGYTTDEIFEGPALEHGFIDTRELERTTLRETVYASDIISLVMDIKGVLAVRGLRMTKYGKNGKPVAAQTGKSWCMPVMPLHKPLLSETRSKILFYKNKFPYLPGLTKVRDTLRWLRAVHARNKLTGHADDLELSTGQYSALDEYTSIDYLFPQTYGIGKAGLPATTTEERKAQAKQLKSYLLFYDQLLADFFSQLHNAKELFSVDNIQQTYFGQYLSNIKDIGAIYKTDSSNHSLLETVLNSPDSSVTTLNDWQRLYEPNATFIDRRNRFLDHLMARFAESFNDYVLLMFSLDCEAQKETKIEPAHIIDNKIQFLQTYPKVSYERAQAFNYFPQVAVPEPVNFTIDNSKLWDTDNVSGIEEKISRLAGISNVIRRYLYCFTQADIITTEDTPAKYQFVFTNEYNDTITSFTAYEKEGDALAAVQLFLELAKSQSHYTAEASGSSQRLVIKDESNSPVAVSSNFPDEATAIEATNKFIEGFNKECDSTGLHLIEHILLRPRVPADPVQPFVLAPVCLDTECDFCGEQDPYSFRMSIVLPYWPDHFKNLAFRDYFESLIQSEAPAHTIVKVCWINNTSMRKLEVVYKQWLTVMGEYAADKTTVGALKAANDSLIDILFHLHSEYPIATLHNCEESKNTNPVMLGRTILGSFKTE